MDKDRLKLILYHIKTTYWQMQQILPSNAVVISSIQICVGRLKKEQFQGILKLKENVNFSVTCICL